MNLLQKKFIGTLALLSLVVFQLAPIAYAANTAPMKMMYDGKLLDLSGSPITTPHTIRFSMWIGGDATADIYDEYGDIDATTTGFAGWEEEHTITPDSTGYFQVELGSVNGMLDFQTLRPEDMPNLTLQVEVKPQGAPDTEYVLLDSNSGDDGHDRSAFTSVPFAMNANLLDNRSIGSLEGDIPVIGVGGQFEMSLIPSGTNNSQFVIDADDSEEVEITLQFGQELKKKLSYDVVNETFKFNDSVEIDGDLSVTGLINGVDITQIPGALPTLQQINFHPEYTGASYTADGSDNTGQLHNTHDSASGNNQYLWTSTRESLQDYDIVVPFTIPQGFVSWNPVAPISLSYKTGTALNTDNKVSISMTDTTRNTVVLVGSSSGLASATWAETSLTFLGTNEWTAGEEILIRIKLHSKEENPAQIGRLRLQYIGQNGS